MSQDPQHKPKTTIIPANPGMRSSEGLDVIAWVIEDGQLVRAICLDPLRDVETIVQRTPAGSSHE